MDSTEPEERRTLVEAYCAVPPDDPFAASRDMFSELAGELPARDSGDDGLPRLEELVDERDGGSGCRTT